MNPLPLASIGLGWSDHFSALWWLGLLYRRPRQFQAALSTCSVRQQLATAFWLLVHSAPYVFALSAAGYFLGTSWNDSNVGHFVAYKIIDTFVVGITFGIGFGIGVGIVVWIPSDIPSAIATGIGFGTATDVEVIYLLKRGLGMPNPAPLAPQQITVIEKDDQHRGLHVHPVGQRYRALFGDNIDFRTEGFSAWLAACQQFNPALVPGLP